MRMIPSPSRIHVSFIGDPRSAPLASRHAGLFHRMRTLEVIKSTPPLDCGRRYRVIDDPFWCHPEQPIIPTTHEYESFHGRHCHREIKREGGRKDSFLLPSCELTPALLDHPRHIQNEFTSRVLGDLPFVIPWVD